MRFKDQVVMVTGAARGIGAATARAFGREGARVAVLDIDAPGAQAVADETKRLGGEALALEPHTAGPTSRTSRASRNPSPNRLKPSTTSISTRPGEAMAWGASRIAERASLIIVPHSGWGG